MNKTTVQNFFEIMEIAQKYHNANMAGQDIPDWETTNDALRVAELAQEIARDTDGNTIYEFVKQEGDLRIYVGKLDRAGQYMAHNYKTRRYSAWKDTPDFTPGDCIY